MRAPTVFSFIAVLLGLLGLLGCGGPSQTDAQIQDALGRWVRITLPIDRVVSIAPSMTELVFEAGAGEKLIAASSSDDYPPSVDTLPRFGVNPVNLEAIVALAPTLVLATDQINHPDQIEPLQRLGISTYFFSFRELTDVPDALRRIGRMFGTSTIADPRADSLDQLIDSLTNRTSLASIRPRVLVLVGSDPLHAFGRGSYVHDVIRRAGGESLTRNLPTPAPVLSEEYVLRSGAEIIIGADSTVFTPARLAELRPGWDLLPALANERVYFIDPDLLFRPGPRLIESAYRIARVLHPELMTSARK